MQITRAIIKNYRCLREANVALNPKLNIIVGDNECGKSTFLEAVSLALSGQLNGRPIITELHPYLFNADTVKEYIDGFAAGKPTPPPTISIELYFADHPDLIKLKGQINSLNEDTPGLILSIELHPDYTTEFAEYVSDPTSIRTLPVEYYVVRWRNFAESDIIARGIPIKPCFIDASTIRNNSAASRYVVDILKDGLSARQQVDMALSYRMMKDKFLQENKIQAINDALSKKKGRISEKTLSVSLDTSSRATWESGVMPHLDDLPLTLIGKGEQNCVKIKLALESSSESHLILVEEPENHLSFSNLNKLIREVSARRADRQLIITTHSSFVLNKLGVESVLLFSRGLSATLHDLNKGTHDYFLKLPGHDTLRLILSERAILVEGPSDELIVQRAFVMKHGIMPLEAGVDVITVSSLAFKRFLEIAVLLKRQVDVVTDNDGDVNALVEKYKDFQGHQFIRIHYDLDPSVETLEPQLLKANGIDTVNSIIGKNYASNAELLHYMKTNKTECALRFFEANTGWVVPEYIARAVG